MVAAYSTARHYETLPTEVPFGAGFHVFRITLALAGNRIRGDVE